MSALAPTLQAWFTDRLIAQRNVSPHTIRAYRDTLRLLLDYAQGRLGRQPSQLDIAELDAPLIAAFLNHLETERANSTRTRNMRLAAIHSLFRYAQHRHPEHAQDIARVLAIPLKRADRAIVTFLDENEIEALLDAPDHSTWTGRRDHALLVLAVQTGLRVSELTGLRCGDVQLTTGPHVRCAGKGRKNRITPLTPTTTAVLEIWLAERAGRPDEPAFPTARGSRLTRDALDHRITKYIDIAAHAPTHRSDATAARRRRHHRDRSVVRTRTRRHHTDLPPRRPRSQRTRDRADHPTRHPPRALQAARHAPRLPRSALIIPTPTGRIRPPSKRSADRVGITRRSR